jgi:hypothetical protein
MIFNTPELQRKQYQMCGGKVCFLNIYYINKHNFKQKNPYNKPIFINAKNKVKKVKIDALRIPVLAYGVSGRYVCVKCLHKLSIIPLRNSIVTRKRT